MRGMVVALPLKLKELRVGCILAPAPAQGKRQRTAAVLCRFGSGRRVTDRFNHA
jgi:hypothetical protein